MNSFNDQSGSSRGDSTPRSPFSPLTANERQKGPADSTKSPRHLANSSSSNPSSPGSMLHGGHKFNEAFQMKQGRFDLQAAKISELMKSNNLDNAPTQSLLSIANGILDDTIERKNGEIPQRVACLLRKVIQEIERRISTQSEHLRTQNTVFKSREEKYQSRIKVLETLASGTSEENEIATKQLRRIRTEKSKLEEKKKNKEDDVVKLEKENYQYNTEISTLRRELETTKKAYEQQCLQMESRTKVGTTGIYDRVKELQQMRKDASAEKLALEERVKELEKMGKEANAAKTALEEKVKELQQFRIVSNDASVEKLALEERVKELEKMGKEANATKTTLEEKVKELQQFKIETISVNTSLEAKNRELEKMGKEANAAKMTLEEKLKELQQVKVETVSVNTSLEAKNRELEKIGKEANAAKMTLEEKLKELQQVKIETVSVNTNLEVENQELKKLGKEANAAKTTLEENVKELQQFKIETISLNTSLEAKNRELEMMGKEVNAAKTTLEEKVKELQQFKIETISLNTSLEAKNRELEMMGKEVDAAKTNLEEKVKELQQFEKQTRTVTTSLEAKNRELEQNLVHWKNKAKEMEDKSDLINQSWTQKELSCRRFINIQFQALQDLRFYSKSIKQEILEVQDNYAEEFSQLGKKLLELGDAAENYHAVLTENQKLFNELQELKGNIRVYCRVRPFLPGQGESNTVVEHIGDYGELVVLNPSKPGKDGFRKFRFNKVYSPASTQAEVFLDIKPLVRSVLDGYNVCIFAYGQTGSGKTYTMTGPDGASEEEWGVNYRALNDLFKISQSRKNNITYEVGVQMVEIYNEQVLDLLSDDSSQKKLGILNTLQQNGLAVPDASMFPVTSTSDVLELMSIGLENRTVSSTALNERSSRSHSIVTVHVRGTDLKTGSTLFGNLHLVDLAGSERIDRSEVTGDRLKEAQHINKSLSALGDVIFSLASKNSHVPYRNSKLTQLLQSSLGGRAKTLMFVQLNPDVTSYSESMSTLKFAERVSGVELGAAKTNKDGRDVRELMEQLGSLKDTIARKDDEIERLHLLKDINYPHRLRGKSLGQSSDFNSEAGDSPIEEDTRFQQSPHSVTDSETIASSIDAEYDERLDDDETEGSIDVPRTSEGRKPKLKISVKTKPVTPRGTATTPRPLDKLKQVATRATTIAKVSSSLASPSKHTRSSSLVTSGLASPSKHTRSSSLVTSGLASPSKLTKPSGLGSPSKQTKQSGLVTSGLASPSQQTKPSGLVSPGMKKTGSASNLSSKRWA